MAIVANKTLTVKSPAFANNHFIPSEYTCNGSNVNPALIISDIPEEAKSLAIVVDDPDAPGSFNHWIMWDIPVRNIIEENSRPGTEGKNSKDENKYAGPCPPSDGTHHYHFGVYALDTTLNLPGSTDKSALLKAMDGHILAFGELIGLFKK
ncbi:MAG: YbhB/YbcL family Raf kinase inhibitor-like protein [Bacteroidetes bacterium]|nr:YbhB/YbcL family Raf kinase inhibitor-like protein [Bacteroidota bacterium]